MEHEFKKSLGQNFLRDTNLLAAIASDAEVTKEDIVVEIGAGAGTLSCILAEKAKQVFAYEIDKSLEEPLTEKFSNYDNISLKMNDIMKVDMTDIFDLTENKPYKVVANLPYYITTPIIFKFLENSKNLISLTIMVQKEVADRIIAKPATENYGALSVMVNHYGTPKITRNVNRKMFFPAPNVDSAVVNIKLKMDREKRYDKVFSEIVSAAFHMRRKTLVNNFAESFGIDKSEASKVVEGAGFDPKVRGETLSSSEFERLAKILLSRQI